MKWLEPPGGTATTYRVTYNGGNDSAAVSVAHAEHSLGDWVLLGNFQFAVPGGPVAQKVSLSGNDWVLLGNFDFVAPGGSLLQGVSLPGDFNNFGSEGTYLEADAVKFVPTFAPEGALDLRYIFNDHLGTPQRVTDEAGTVVWKASYRPFGAATVDEDPVLIWKTSA